MGARGRNNNGHSGEDAPRELIHVQGVRAWVGRDATHSTTPSDTYPTSASAIDEKLNIAV